MGLFNFGKKKAQTFSVQLSVRKADAKVLSDLRAGGQNEKLTVSYSISSSGNLMLTVVNAKHKPCGKLPASFVNEAMKYYKNGNICCSFDVTGYSISGPEDDPSCSVTISVIPE